ncbi:MAG: GspE/PulE family protein [Candidatus Omnitrophica bacterium]|nr:GspE/PulE family protein [Candidatus Omnitrophota bacterium]MDD5670107.1 GspE/PulE family protein [Candidatus Omnitrophota bacterium]
MEEKENSGEQADQSSASRKKCLIDLAKYVIEPNILKLIPKTVALKFTVLPLYLNGQVLFIAMDDPKNITAIDEVRKVTKIHAIIPLYSSKEDILSAIDRHYGLQQKVQDIVVEIQKERLEKTGEEDEASAPDLVAMAEQAPVIKLVNHVIMRAIQEKCSDIHFEPDEKVLRVRCRQDGIMQENYVFQKQLESAILARIKITAGMDIAEKRKPQDGRIKFRLESKQIDIRVSSLPTLYGENIVMRLLDKTSVMKDLGSLGMEAVVLEKFNKLIHYPYGIILVTGPTGSGKSTTLYAGIGAINDVEMNIVTVEDPIEYNLDLIRQTQVNPKVGLTFASGLRAILRQDPDVIMVGEIRDPETAEIASQAALTGHLVLSTLHTNDACGAVTRLADMGIQPFLIASSVIGVLAQRLVRRICENCKEPVTVPPALLKELEIEDVDTVFYAGKGCDRCKQMKYAGRTTIHEIMVMTEEMRELIVKRASQADLFALAKKQGMKALRESGLSKARLGLTTLEEVLKVTGKN